MKILGIDLSLTSPACCLFEGDEFNFNGCQFYFYTTNKKIEGSRHPVYGTLAPEFNHDQERYYNITHWIVSILYDKEPNHIFIEDYSFASTGRVFNILKTVEYLSRPFGDQTSRLPQYLLQW